MGEKNFGSVLILLIPQVVQLIVEHYPIDETTAAEQFYSSQVYTLLEQEDTKLWHFSPLTLFNMFKEEQDQGSFSIPEEA